MVGPKNIICNNCIGLVTAEAKSILSFVSRARIVTDYSGSVKRLYCPAVATDAIIVNKIIA